MANQIPFSGAANASGGYLLPPEQGEILVNGILVETGAIQLSGDARSTKARKTNFPIWLGRPTAGPVGEGRPKPVTGASFGQGTLNIKKFASIVIFTDEQIEDLQNGDLNVLVDAGVRQALSVAVDADAAGLSAGAILEKGATSNGGSVFDTPLLYGGNAGGATGGPVIINAANLEVTGVQEAVSWGLGILEENGYGNPADIGILLGFGFQRILRDARDGYKRPLYDGGTFAGQSIDALYGLDRAHSTNLPLTSSATYEVKVECKNGEKKNKIKTRGTCPLFVGQPVAEIAGVVPAETYITGLVGNAGEETEIEFNNALTKTEEKTLTFGKPVGIVAHKPNIHVRVREDVVVKTSNEATVEQEGEKFNLFQDNLQAILYETRLGYFVHDIARAVVPIWKY